MQLFSWLHKRMTGRGHTRHTSARKLTSRFRPQFETLEGRDLPSFSSPVPYALNGPQALVTADVNGDGKPDLISLVNYGADIAVQLNNGKGTFGTPAEYYDGSSGTDIMTALTVGNVNGKPEIVVAGWVEDNIGGGPAPISVLDGDGKGSFTLAGTYYVLPDNSPVTSLALADVYGNGTLDLVGTDTAGDVFVAGPGNGSPFGAVQTLNTPALWANPGLSAVAVGDFNGDGKPDIVVANSGVAMSGDSVGVLLNNGNGTFAAQTYTVGGSPTSVAIGDFNRDGKPDIVTANANGTVSVLLNNGTGAFGTAQNYTLGGPANSVAVGDFNHDGYLDVAAAGSTETDLLLNNGNGTFGAYQEVGPAGSNVVAADFNGDGFPDLAQIDPSQASIDVLFNNPNGSLTGAGFPSSTTAGVAHRFTVTALNPDGTVNTNYTGTVHFSSSDPQAMLPANYKFTAADQGVHTFSITLKTAGSQFITATDTNDNSLVGGETGITVAPAAAVALVFGNVPSGLTAGSTFNLWLTAKDAYGNTATGYTGTVHFTSSDPRAVLPADFTFTSGNAGNAFWGLSVALKTAGTQSVTATDTVTSTITTTTSGIAVFPAAASQFTLSVPATVTSRAKFSLTLTVEDAYGNVVPYYAFTVHFSSSDSTAKLPSDYTFTYSDAGVHTFKNVILNHKGKQTITVTDTQIASLTVTVSIDVI
jgi:hypothetical protein